MIERTPQEEIPEGFFMLGLVLPRVAVIAATLSFLGEISEKVLNQVSVVSFNIAQVRFRYEHE
jgi:hypothetical protein